MGETNKKKNFFFAVRSSSAVGFNEGQDMADLLHPRHCWRCEVLLLLLFWKWRQKRDDTDATSWNTLMDQEREGKEYKDVKHKKSPAVSIILYLSLSFFLTKRRSPLDMRRKVFRGRASSLIILWGTNGVEHKIQPENVLSPRRGIRTSNNFASAKFIPVVPLISLR